MTTSRRVDRKPETAVDKRFFDLRESRYRGPIDQDGNKAITGKAVEILARIASHHAA